MLDPLMVRELATLVVVPRERHSFALESLECLLRHSQDCRVIVVNGRSPRSLRRRLEGLQAQGKIELLQYAKFLAPNQARNLGAARVRTPYIVFADNDILVAPGWLEHLLDCAESTSAAVVSPLTLEGPMEDERIHVAGGRVQIEERDGIRQLVVDQRHYGQQLSDVRSQLHRDASTMAEFHCVLVRRSCFERVGPLDEKLLTTREHVDLSLSMQTAGESMAFEPGSIVTYMPPRPLQASDLPYYFFRWNAARTRSTIRHFEAKWGVSLGFRAHVVRQRRIRAIVGIIKHMSGRA